MELSIKNMVCGRCIMVVKDELLKLGITPLTVDLGVVTLADDQLSEDKYQILSEKLLSIGFELLDTSKSKLIEKIKIFVIDRVHHSQNLDIKINWSGLLSNQLHHDYNYLSSLFSSVEGVTLEQYIIRQKIEKAKEFLFYDEKTLSEIAYFLGYSSVQHLSTQFKKVTGQTPSQFKKSRTQLKLRKPLDEVG
jgi:AraC family transcriptional regulator